MGQTIFHCGHLEYMSFEQLPCLYSIPILRHGALTLDLPNDVVAVRVGVLVSKLMMRVAGVVRWHILRSFW